MSIAIAYKDDYHRAEQIMLETVERHTKKISEMSEEGLEKMRRHYYALKADLRPRVYLRMTDNWLELTVRFLANVSGTRDLKDAMSRDILAVFDEAGIGIASATYDIVGLPPHSLKGRRPSSRAVGDAGFRRRFRCRRRVPRRGGLDAPSS
jgi:small-conductance mechanosensitive channel